MFFFVGVILSLSGLAIAGSLDREPSVLALAMSPGVVVGYVVGRRTRGLVDGDAFRWGVLVVCTISALAPPGALGRLTDALPGLADVLVSP